jgi:uncharacterized RDD family membrane protein YckC
MADNTIFCSECGTQSAAGAVFCQKCGNNLAPGLAPLPAGAVTQLPPPGVPVPAVSPYGGFWIRVVARIIDSTVVSLVLSPLFFVFMLPAIVRLSQSGPDEEPPLWFFTAFPLIWIVAVVAVWLYDALLTSSSWQGTVGKRVLGLKVTDLQGNRISFGRATGRFFGKILSHMACHIGYIMVAFTERKQGLHDMIAGTLVWKA